MSVSISDPTILNFGAAASAGSVVVGDYAYFRIKNLDDTNSVMLSLFNGTDTFFYKLAAGDTFLLMNNEMDAIAGEAFGTFEPIERIKADANEAACDVEILCVTT
jgi:hypothetical protein